MIGSEFQKDDPAYGSAASPGADGQSPRPFDSNVGSGPLVTFADLCHRLVTDAYMPAAVLIDGNHQCLYAMGSTDRYLRMASGPASHDLFSMTPHSFQAQLRSAVQRAEADCATVAVSGCRNNLDPAGTPFSIEVRPVTRGDEKLLLICFLDAPRQLETSHLDGAGDPSQQISALEEQLDGVRGELHEALRRLAILDTEHMIPDADRETNFADLKESYGKLQALNRDLAVQNHQLKCLTHIPVGAASDLRNVLANTPVATLFLDHHLNIRFFTPTMAALFHILPRDLGRPIADLSALVEDIRLSQDAQEVLLKFEPIEREIATRGGVWFRRRIGLCRADDRSVEGVIITVTDISEYMAVANALKIAEAQVQLAYAAKSRFLAAASHDLRQPMQTLALLQGILATKIEGEKEKKLLVRFDETLSAMSNMLDTLVDLDQIEAGTVRTDVVSFPVSQLLSGLHDEFSSSAQAQDLAFTLVPCRLTIRSDVRLLSQMIRNLLLNALKFTKKGRILLGCRRHGEVLRIEVWDTGIGVPQSEWQRIFEEHHQLDHDAREKGPGLGLGLAIVQSLGKLLDHRIAVAARPGAGSVFSIDVPIVPSAIPGIEPQIVVSGDENERLKRRTGTVLIIEDEPDVRGLLEIFLKAEGHLTITAADGVAALAIFGQSALRPDLVLADYNLPGDRDGLQIVAILRKKFHRQLPVIILTGDVSPLTLRHIAENDCVQLNKPVTLKDLSAVVQHLLPVGREASVVYPGENSSGAPIIFVVDDDRHLREALRSLLEDEGHIVEDFESCEAFLRAFRAGTEACLLIDAYLPGMSGLELLDVLKEAGHHLPSIMITGSTDVQTAVLAMKAGASDFIEKPFSRDELLTSLERALEQSRNGYKQASWRISATEQIAGLTKRQQEIMTMVLAGHPSKNIAADLGISQRTVENHRASIMKKTGSRSLPALARLAVAASE